MAGAAVAATIVLAVMLVMRGPWWIDGEHLSEKDLRSGSATLVTGFRTAVVQLLVVLGASIALIFTAFNYRLSRRGQVTDRFTKALERLGSSELYVRLGGVLALEQIVQDAPDQAANAARVLNAFIRQRAPRRPSLDGAPHLPRGERIAALRRAARRKAVVQPTPEERLPFPPDADVQYALAALSRSASRRNLDVDINLGQLHLAGADLSHGDIRGINFGDADMEMADFQDAVADRAAFGWVNLRAARLSGASLRGASLRAADIWRGEFVGADLTDADLVSAMLDSAFMERAILTRARIGGADFENANGLTAEQIISAYPTAQTKLPSDIAELPSVAARIKEVEADESIRHNKLPY
ncbi:pentapeptide repeat-containing protein [Streptomyces sp. NPDC057253]|uniref:pentapeptide repeat-containing protein n=1 Tax=Streptomyces sp. NPDC057253 TaxID=3346069 RepID=UPI00362FB644